MFESYDDILNIREVAKILKVSSTQFYKLVRSSELKAYKERKDWKIPKSALNLYIKTRIGL